MITKKNCVICTKEFIDPTISHNKKYCSKLCKDTASNFQRKNKLILNIKKICKGCKKEFIQKHSRNKNYCNLDCYNKYYTEWKNDFYKRKYHTDQEFKNKILERCRLYHKKNPHIMKRSSLKKKKRMMEDGEYRKKRSDYVKRYVLLNKEKIRKRIKNWRLKTINIRKEKAKEYQIKNREKIKEYLVEWFNRPEVKLRRNMRQKERRKEEPFFRMKLSLRGRLNSFIRRGRAKKMVSHNKLIGCDWKFFKIYLEKKFKAGMTWENYGKWHVDHFKPMTSFNLFKLKDQKECCCYKNLQPLWAWENRQKSNKIIQNLLN